MTKKNPLQVLGDALADTMDAHATGLERYAQALDAATPGDRVRARKVQKRLDAVHVALTRCSGAVERHLKKRVFK